MFYLSSIHVFPGLLLTTNSLHPSLISSLLTLGGQILLSLVCMASTVRLCCLSYGGFDGFVFEETEKRQRVYIENLKCKCTYRI